MSIFVGLDCGGSSSRIMAVDAVGQILFQGHSGAANLASTPETRVRRNLAHAAKDCPTPTHVCGCFAGLINDDMRQRGLEHLKLVFPQAVVRAEPDYTAAFYASPPETDICVIAGTGSLVCSRGPEGMRKTGGRGYLLGDLGSAFQFGRDGLVHFLDHPRDRSEILRNAVLELFGSMDEAAIISTVYRATTPATVLAKLAKAVAQDARAGQAYALDSLNKNLGQLAELVSRHAQTHFPDKKSISICLAGGVWKAAPIFKEVFAVQLSSHLERREVLVQRISRPPLHGAVELAREMSIGN